MTYPNSDPVQYPSSSQTADASAASMPLEGGLVTNRADTKMEQYARETRNAAVFIAWVIGIFAAISIVGGIIMAVQIIHLDNAINNSLNGNTGSTCQSLGGTDPSC